MDKASMSLLFHACQKTTTLQGKVFSTTGKEKHSQDMTPNNYDPKYRDQRHIARGMKAGASPCDVCGRPKNRHTISEARECQKEQAKLLKDRKVETKVSHVSEDYIRKNGHNFIKR